MAIFFILFFFAAYLPMTAIIEVTTVGLVDQFGLSRRRAYAFVAVTTLVLAIPSAISPLSGGFLYNLDIFVGAIGLVVGSMIGVITFMWYLPKKTVLKEVNAGSRVNLGNKWYVWTKYVTPVFTAIVLLYVLSDVLSGVRGLNTENESDYILFEGIVDIIPITVVLLIVLSFFLYIADKRRSPIPITA
jgi:SNF family Na+-dependent transporter